MISTIKDDSTLTDRYQTNIPASVRRALKLKHRDRIDYTARTNGEVLLTRARNESSFHAASPADQSGVTHESLLPKAAY